MACANFAKFSFQKYSQRPAITRAARVTRSNPPSLWRHGGMARLGVTQARAARGTYCDPSHSSRAAASQAHSPPPESPAVARHPSISTARLARRSPSHSQQPAVTRSGLPTPAAGRHSRLSVVTRSGPPSLATARLNQRGPGTRRGQSHSDVAAARLCSPQPASLTQ